ncbi:MAG: ribosome silencing factor [Acidobacteria bacterium]|nr:ribosome silencing factor [Acidobacteriota bacterium]
MGYRSSSDPNLSTKKTPTRKTAPRKSVRKTISEAISNRTGAGPVRKRPAAKTARTVKEPQSVAADAVWQTAVRAAEDRKALDVKVLDLRQVTSFTDFLIICTGTNPRQIQAISDAIEDQLKQLGERPKSVEGYNNAEWILMDYTDYVVNIFSENARSFYDLERLWRDASSVATS